MNFSITRGQLSLKAAFSLGLLLLVVLWFDVHAINAFFEPKWFAAALGILPLLWMGASKQPVLRSPRLAAWWLWGWVGLLCWNALTFLWLPAWRMGIERECQWVTAAAYGLFGLFVSITEDFFPFTETMIVIGAVEATLGAIQVVRFPLDWPRAIIGSAGYHTFLSDALVVLLPFLVFGALRRTRPLIRVVACGAIIESFIVLVTIGSRSAFLGLGVELAVLFVALRSRPLSVLRLGVQVIAAASVLAVLGISLMLLPKISGPIERTQEDLSAHLSGRKLIWLSSLSMASKSPFLGVGIGGFPYYYYVSQGQVFRSHPVQTWYPAREVVLSAHDEPLQELCEGGVVGLLLLLLIVLGPLAAIARELLIGTNRDPFLYVLLAALLGMIPSILLAFPFQVPLNAILDCMLLGAAVVRLNGIQIGLHPRKLLALLTPVLLISATLLGFSYLSSRLLERGLQMEERNPKDAWVAYKQGIAFALNKGLARALAGSFALREKKDVIGEELLLDSLKTFRDTYVYENLARLYQQEGRYSDSLAMFEKAREGGIRYIPDTCDMAIVQALSGHLEEARTSLQRLITAFPQNCQVYLTLAKLDVGIHDFQGALLCLKRPPCRDAAEFHLLKGTSLLGLGRFQEAETELYACLQRDPHNVDAMNNLALEYALTKRVKLALSMYKRVLRVDPQNQVALSNLATLSRGQ